MRRFSESSELQCYRSLVFSIMTVDVDPNTLYDAVRQVENAIFPKNQLGRKSTSRSLS
jgi:hypothetical protein